MSLEMKGTQFEEGVSELSAQRRDVKSRVYKGREVGRQTLQDGVWWCLLPFPLGEKTSF